MMLFLGLKGSMLNLGGSRICDYVRGLCRGFAVSTHICFKMLATCLLSLCV